MKELSGDIVAGWKLQVSRTSLNLPGPSIQSLDLSSWTRLLLHIKPNKLHDYFLLNEILFLGTPLADGRSWPSASCSEKLHCGVLLHLSQASCRCISQCLFVPTGWRLDRFHPPQPCNGHLQLVVSPRDSHENLPTIGGVHKLQIFI